MAVTTRDYVAKTHKSVRKFFRGAVDLRGFVDSAGSLSLAQRRTIVAQALALLGQTYVHLPLKEAMHAANPMQALRVLEDRLAETTTQTMGTEFEFHSQMLRIFLSVRDLHTNYILPAPFANWVAFVPFNIERFVEDGESRYLVSHLVPGFSHTHFREEVEVTGWNGIAIDRAVEVIAERHAGSNAAARLARGVELLTQRALVRSLPPDEAWVEVDYIDLNGNDQTLRFDWQLFDTSGASGAVDLDRPTIAATSMAVSLEQDTLTRAKRLLFAPKAEEAMGKKPKLSSRVKQGDDVNTALPGVFRARSVSTASGEVGHLRIFTFSVEDPHEFVNEARRLVSLLPQDRLIIDVRGNGGGHIWASEGLLQLFTPRRVSPEPTQFLATPLTRRLCDRHKNDPVGIDLGAWLPSLRLAVQTGSVYSTGHPITPPDFANQIGQTYRGRVAVITNALCYSATDIFAAGFQDHEIGPVVGVENNTGAGGANVWTHDLLRTLMRIPDPDPASPFTPLPSGVAMRVSIRRTLRVGDRAGTPLEDLGVQPDRLEELTRNDLVNGNADLLDTVAATLDRMPLRVLDVTNVSTNADITTVTVETDNIGRLDLHVNGRPYASQNVRQGPNEIEVPGNAQTLRLEGFSGPDLVVSNTVTLA